MHTNTKILVLVLIIFLAGCTVTKNPRTCSISKDGKCGHSSFLSKTKKEISSSSSEFSFYKLKRIQENVQAIWIAPYEDEEGDFHESSYIYAVINKGTWFK